ncbi:MAG TPA: TadE/TadG family type IV pilus assembly protein [Acidimicrobiales bacterium]|nr:TadE/TadG family type IV pilus assembly protein [Acidimicrobiales bacterium]
MSPSSRPGAPHNIPRACSGSRRRRDESGAALVEFALILPVFALMLFAMIQFGLAFAGWDELRNAVQTGARMASMGQTGSAGTDCPDIDQYRHTHPHPNASTREMVCEIELNLIGQPLGTAAGTTPPQVALYISGDNTVTVCARVPAEQFTGFFPTITLSTNSALYLQSTSDLENYDPYNPPFANCPA